MQATNQLINTLWQKDTKELKDKLLTILAGQSYKEGKFVLVSGKESNFYLEDRNGSITHDVLVTGYFSTSSIGKSLIWILIVDCYPCHLNLLHLLYCMPHQISVDYVIKCQSFVLYVPLSIFIISLTFSFFSGACPS